MCILKRWPVFGISLSAHSRRQVPGSAEWEVKGIKLEIEGMAQKELGNEKWSRKFDRLAWWALWA